jgi:hypothetical protein
MFAKKLAKSARGGEMKNAKKCTAAPIAFILLLVLLAPGAASAAAGPAVTVDALSGGYAAGDTAAVPVKIAGNPGCEAATLKLAYDTDALELAGYTTDGTLFEAGSVVDNHAKGIIGFFGAGSDIKENGTLFIANFTVKAGARAGSYPISIGAYQNLPGNFVNWDMEPVSPAFAAGSIPVVGAAGGNTAGSPAPAASGSTSAGGSAAASAQSEEEAPEETAESESAAQGQDAAAASRIGESGTALAPGAGAPDPDGPGRWTAAMAAWLAVAIIAAAIAGFFAIRYFRKRSKRQGSMAL